MGLYQDDSIREVAATETIKFTNSLSDTKISAKHPVHLYYNSSKVLLGARGTVDSSSHPRHWGIITATVDSGGEGYAIIKGLATVVQGGTAGQQVTSIAATGTITDASAASTNTDLSLGVSVSTTTLYIY